MGSPKALGHPRDLHEGLRSPEACACLGLNKVDALTDEEIAEKRTALEEAGAERVMVLSGATGIGVLDVLRAMKREIDAERAALAPEVEEAWVP